jgi:LysM repeat protein
MENLHPILAKRGITPGTPEAVLKVAEVFVQMKYEEGPTKDNLFGKWFGANHTAWCAEFVSYCFNKAGAGYVVNGLQTKQGYLSCTRGIAAMKKRGMKQVPVAEAQPGDIIFFDWEHDHDPDHTGIVLKNNPKKKIVTCREGNTSRGDGSKSNGGQVAQRDRNYSVVFAVFRPDWKPVKATVKPTIVPPVAAKPVITAPAPIQTSVVVKEPVAVAKPTEPQHKIYIIKSGDSYWKIATEHGMDVKILQKLNGFKALHPNDKIRLN